MAVALNLAARSGYGVKLPNENVEQDGSARALCDSVVAHLSMKGGVSIVGSDGASSNQAVSIEHDGTTAEITLDEFQQFADELADFASVRLSRIFNRATASD